MEDLHSQGGFCCDSDFGSYCGGNRAWDLQSHDQSQVEDLHSQDGFGCDCDFGSYYGSHHGENHVADGQLPPGVAHLGADHMSQCEM